MNILLQILVVVLTISYKYYLAKQKLAGWILGALCSLSVIAYYLVFLMLPILITLESCFLILCIYGMYKHLQQHDRITVIDIIVTILTFLVIIYFVANELHSDTLWFETIASTAFLVGALLLAQKHSLIRICGWLLFATGNSLLIIVMMMKKAYIIVTVDILSIVIAAYAIAHILMEKKNSRIA